MKSNGASGGDAGDKRRIRGFIYIIREREFIRLGEPVYKIGKTTQDINKRTMSYPKNSELLMCVAVGDCHSAEKECINYFVNKYKHHTEYGREYFSGSLRSMMADILSIIVAIEVDDEVDVDGDGAETIGMATVIAESSTYHKFRQHWAMYPGAEKNTPGNQS